MNIISLKAGVVLCCKTVSAGFVSSIGRKSLFGKKTYTTTIQYTDNVGIDRLITSRFDNRSKRNYAFCEILESIKQNKGWEDFSYEPKDEDQAVK